METSVKWNLDEATEISVLSGLDVIRFVKSSRGGSYRYGVEKEIDGKIVITGARRVMTEALPALLEKYEAAGCGVLVATERKRTVLEPLKMGTKMVEVSTKKFDWKDVKTVNIYKYGRKFQVFKFKGNSDGEYVRGREVFERYSTEADGQINKSNYMWDEREVKAFMLDKTVEMFEIYNHDGELLNYEQN